MLEEGGVPGLERHDTPSELLQPLVPRYEAALSQLERAVKVRDWWGISWGNPLWGGRGVPRPGLCFLSQCRASPPSRLGGRVVRGGWPHLFHSHPCPCRKSGGRRRPRPGLRTDQQGAWLPLGYYSSSFWKHPAYWQLDM